MSDSNNNVYYQQESGAWANTNGSESPDIIVESVEIVNRPFSAADAERFRNMNISLDPGTVVPSSQPASYEPLPATSPSRWSGGNDSSSSTVSLLDDGLQSLDEEPYYSDGSEADLDLIFDAEPPSVYGIRFYNYNYEPPAVAAVEPNGNIAVIPQTSTNGLVNESSNDLAPTVTNRTAPAMVNGTNNANNSLHPPNRGSNISFRMSSGYSVNNVAGSGSSASRRPSRSQQQANRSVNQNQVNRTVNSANRTVNSAHRSANPANRAYNTCSRTGRQRRRFVPAVYDPELGGFVYIASESSDSDAEPPLPPLKMVPRRGNSVSDLSQCSSDEEPKKSKKKHRH